MNLSPVLRQRFQDANGLPLAGGKLFTYQAGTTTPQVTYTDAGGLTPNTNPVILDADGYADVWLNPSLSYKFLLKDSLNVDQWSVDNVIGLLATDSVGTDALQDGAVTEPKLAALSVTQEKLAAEVLGPYSLMNYSLVSSVASNALTIALKTATGANPSVLTMVNIPFRSVTDSDGSPVFRSVTVPTSVTVSSGSTLGSVSAQPNWIYVYAIDNGGTVELAVSASKSWDEGSTQSTTTEGGAGAADSKTVLYSTTARSSKAVRLLGRVRSTQATAGTWVTSPSEISLVPLEQRAPRSSVLVREGNGHGSTNTKTRRFLTSIESIGLAITRASSSTTGDSFTINEDGLYAINYNENSSPAANFGISVNSSQLTTAIDTITQSTHYGQAAVTAGTGQVSVSTRLAAGDVVRAHTDGVPTGSTGNEVIFRITKVSD